MNKYVYIEVGKCKNNITKMYTYNNKIAFITGALGTIGKTYAKYLLQNNIKGIALVDILKPDEAYQQELELTYGENKCIFVQVDVGNKAELKNAFETTVKHFGQLDIVINNAGIGNEEEDYSLMLNINFMAIANGFMMALHEYLPKYKEGPGVIVNTASVLGLHPNGAVPMYSVSKHAIVAIGMCYEHHPDCLNNNIRVLTMCPGPIQSNLLTKEAIDKLKKSTLFKEIVPAAKSADFLGEGLIKIINEGNNGAVWMFVNEKEPRVFDYHPNQKIALDYMSY